MTNTQACDNDDNSDDEDQTVTLQLYWSADHCWNTCPICKKNRDVGSVDDFVGNGYTIPGLVSLVRQGYFSFHCESDEVGSIINDQDIILETLKLYIEAYVCYDILQSELGVDAVDLGNGCYSEYYTKDQSVKRVHEEQADCEDYVNEKDVDDCGEEGELVSCQNCLGKKVVMLFYKPL